MLRRVAPLLCWLLVAVTPACSPPAPAEGEGEGEVPTCEPSIFDELSAEGFPYRLGASGAGDVLALTTGNGIGIARVKDGVGEMIEVAAGFSIPQGIAAVVTDPDSETTIVSYGRYLNQNLGETHIFTVSPAGDVAGLGTITATHNQFADTMLALDGEGDVVVSWGEKGPGAFDFETTPFIFTAHLNIADLLAGELNPTQETKIFEDANKGAALAAIGDTSIIMDPEGLIHIGQDIFATISDAPGFVIDVALEVDGDGVLASSLLSVDGASASYHVARVSLQGDVEPLVDVLDLPIEGFRGSVSHLVAVVADSGATLIFPDGTTRVISDGFVDGTDLDVDGDRAVLALWQGNALHLETICP